MPETSAFLTLDGISKHYGGVFALNNVHFEASKASIHAILGENGAGKSTLMKSLVGVVHPEEGSILLEGQKLSMHGASDAAKHGIVCIFQELSIVPDLNVAANICLADPPRNKFGLIDRKEQARLARETLQDMGVGLDIDVRSKVADLPLSKRQIVEIAKAVIRKPKVLILDEATSALTAADVEPVMALLRRLRDEGTLILFISHRMHEVEALADTCSVFRNGEHVETFATGSRSDEEIVQMMIGKPLSQIFPEKAAGTPAAAPYLETRGLAWNGKLKGVDLDVRPGEIVGLGGLDGQGQQEVLQALAGVLRGVSGDIRIGEQTEVPNGPRGGLTDGYRVALVPEDRKTGGLFLPQSIANNLTAPILERISPRGVVSETNEQSRLDEMIRTLQIKVSSADLAVSTLSGGNQQKVVIAKWLATKPKLLLLIDPTRGIDVGTKQEIYKLLRDLANDGLAILLYTTDYDELIGLCDRALVMYDGRINAELSGDQLTEQNILSSALNMGGGAEERVA
ncbi:sugar ABC transporter ATP-binding protein [Shimia sp. CNT1-13L.2]|uniref:sugar ABC transporter ATP-binding protein n=1 Tax=Shimia sp. CNT1-13L.2 TaxID=2959663 RepID=UPI0020CFDE0F|nr:sugar ABC transporter ATP-binding protein [Shimia sp. CNT1-13L.2]MCP9484209.1 sugar ABC transporter ATP-binding protein [Shimia sp. CNT1-13L.2]